MARNSGFLEYVITDVMQDIPGITSRPMFGGYGIYKEGIIFAIIIQDSLYFKVGESNRQDFIEVGSQPFIYEAKNRKPVAMSYWKVPEDILENKRMIQEWITKAVIVSQNAKKK